jgi:hypothetical protein
MHGFVSLGSLGFTVVMVRDSSGLLSVVSYRHRYRKLSGEPRFSYSSAGMWLSFTKVRVFRAGVPDLGVLPKSNYSY